jgi:hypothetical protein
MSIVSFWYIYLPTDVYSWDVYHDLVKTSDFANVPMPYLFDQIIQLPLFGLNLKPTFDSRGSSW